MWLRDASEAAEYALRANGNFVLWMRLDAVFLASLNDLIARTDGWRLREIVMRYMWVTGSVRNYDEYTRIGRRSRLTTMLNDAVAFLSALRDQWLMLMGGAMMLALTLYERFRRNAPGRLWLVLMTAFLMWAAFGAWREERAGRTAADIAREELQATIVQKDEPYRSARGRGTSSARPSGSAAAAVEAIRLRDGVVARARAECGVGGLRACATSLPIGQSGGRLASSSRSSWRADSSCSCSRCSGRQPMLQSERLTCGQQA